MRGILNFRSGGSPLARVLAAVIAALLLAGAVVLGAVLAGLLLGLVLVGSLAFMGRVWWLRRRLRRTQPPFATGSTVERPPIDAEFHVIESESRSPPISRQPKS